MKFKNFLSVLLIMTMVLSVCIVAHADYTYFIPVKDFSTTTYFTPNGANLTSQVVDDNHILQINKQSTSTAKLYSSKYDTTGANGVVYEFDIKQLSNNGAPAAFSVYMNNAAPLFKISNDSKVTYVGLANTEYTLNKDSWYRIILKVDYNEYRVYGIIKDASGSVVHRKSFKQGSGYIRNEMAGKASSSVDLFLSTSNTGDVFCLDNFSVRALEADEMDILPVSITTTIVEEDYDDLNPEPVVLDSGEYGWSYAMYGNKPGWENCLNGKGVVAGGYLGTVSIKETSTGSSDKYLEFNLNTQSGNSIEYLYQNTLNKNNYIQELTFKVEENVQNMSFRYRNGTGGSGNVSVTKLDFVNGKVSLGDNSADFDFVPGTIYTAKSYYAWDANKGKIEITDGTKSVVLMGSLPVNNATDTQAPSIIFYSDECCDEGRIISIYNYNIYTTNEESCELKTKYLNLKLSKNVFEEGVITASVDVESNASFNGYINNAATLFLAVYENGELSSLKSVQVPPEFRNFSVDNIIGASDTSVKAMLWNVDDGTLTPLFASKELAKQ